MPLLSRLAVQAARAYGALSFADRNAVPASYLIVAGGAGGGWRGGGGAGGFQTSTFTLSTLNTYSVVVGSGGSASVANDGAQGGNGNNSSVSGTGLTTVTSTGGGGGGGSNSAGSNGGSGGGGGVNNNQSVTYAGGTGTSGQGNNGGSTFQPTGGSTSNGGGGGGATSAGSAATNASTGGAGGSGTSSSISGSSVTYAGGGGGGATSTGGTGGTGGGGNGSNSSTAGTSGTVNLGAGGGGGGLGQNAGQGGSGIVIISYASATPKFVGGTLTTSGGNQIHTFTSSGTLSPLTPVTASYLVVAGGGGGGRQYGGQGAGGGGGAGGLLTSSTTLYSGATYVVTVGAGGAGGSSAGAAPSGSNSSLSGTGLTTVTSTGGGGGAGSSGSGASGGSGGGGQGETAPKTGGAGTSGQGFAGGTGAAAGGGGGGASAVGANAATNVSGGNGGAGTASSISGTSVTYAGGGGGGGYTSTAGTGGAGGGGTGQTGQSSTALAVSGTTNLGGGGGGAGYVATGNYNGAAGGSGVVIISYAGSQVFNGGLVTSSGGNTIHTFNATGALTPLTNNLNNSLRFRSSASAYLSRTPTLASNRTTWTWSAWVKRGTIDSGASQYFLFSAYTAASDAGYTAVYFSGDQLSLTGYNTVYRKTTQVFRDPSAWYHVVVVWDSSQGTASNRIKIYINGSQVTAFATSNDPTSSQTSGINAAGVHSIGANSNTLGANLFDGYMTDINFIDGQALEPYYFGNNDANGVWKPIKYTGTYGTNGFYLNFSNTTSTTTLGNDSSGNGNNWTTNNISLTAGVTYDAMTDVPTNTSATVANYAVLNPLDTGANTTISDGNLKYVTSSNAAVGTCRGTFGVTSGKWYFEITAGSTANANTVGIANANMNVTTGLGDNANGWGYSNDGYLYNNGTPTNTSTTWGNGDIAGIAFDADSGKLWFAKNNTWVLSGNPSAGTNPAFTGLTGNTFFPAVSDYGGGSTSNLVANFGQRPFSYTPPTGFVALNTYNLPTPTILQGNKYMDATLYTGNGSTQTIVNQGQFKPDFVWVKRRDGAGQDHVLQDSNRGFSGTTKLASSSTAAENTTGGATGSEWGSVTAANSNGFSITASTNGDQVNKNTWTYVGWQWQAGQGSTSSNTSGSITSTVSVNATAGFSVVTYTSQASGTATFGHGLGVAPSMIFLKGRNVAGGWYVYHSALGGTKYLALQSTGAATTASDGWNNTNPTSTVVSVGNGYAGSYNMVAYCWADVSGFSKAFSYTGNGSSDGVFTYLGFSPKFILIKRTDTTGNWYIWDTARNTYNVLGEELYPNLSNAASTATDLDVLSNGFKLRNSTAGFNASSGTYIGMAWASNPFKNSNAF